MAKVLTQTNFKISFYVLAWKKLCSWYQYNLYILNDKRLLKLYIFKSEHTCWLGNCASDPIRRHNAGLQRNYLNRVKVDCESQQTTMKFGFFSLQKCFWSQLGIPVGFHLWYQSAANDDNFIFTFLPGSYFIYKSCETCCNSNSDLEY